MPLLSRRKGFSLKLQGSAGCSAAVLLLAASASAAWIAVPVAEAADSLVIVMRHGDKGADHTNYNLSPAGFRRSLALARLIPACFATPRGILTYPMNPSTGKNARSYQTAVPLAMATGVNIRIAEGAERTSFAIGQQLRQQAEAGAGLQVLFWEHRRIPELVRGLGWSAMPSIAEEDFDQLIQLRYSGPGRLPRVEVSRQSDLFLRPCFLSSRQAW